MLTLAIETSCDETSVAVIKDGREVLSNIISSQIDIHRKFGGVVPEIASRKHIESINNIVQEAIDEAKISFDDIDLIGVTKGPGLVGALLIGISTAKALAYGLNKPIIGVNHIEGHVCANYIEHKDLEPPFTCLIVSGGHTYLVQVNGYTDYELVGRTRDDAAGEAFDKVARALGLPYPGGPVIDKLAQKGNKTAIDFPRVMLEPKSYDFSFSGLKTAVLNCLNQKHQKSEEIIVEDVAASFQQAVLDVLVDKSFRLAKERKSQKIVIAGGVAANQGLRTMMEERGKEEGIEILYPSRILCTDNAAMIGAAAYFNYKNGNKSDLYLNVIPNLDLK
ncbi:tRNA (adenosine(37)-N6)-threonylcarbamoyltransferase complex transferase subunit TsaD [Tissierella sp. MB52-C2]|uniref:tRNA (adenosine(37)-N6)-threonylcarbamoyltransferase complex transferase subunit TsaD n=1 Tax=Tissierella sp. MB52-C2 TaxID=3070999 RepID=UPI00280B0BA9|nr:tRNA (adenosine(37)-N6)-threonylcarbamoyltransferase complex transferase subunit TsaD [Tissierella sp. MB52-C2]WMM24132.1 tRNA (adenosine(37)-N6)-threonylcarbamoyltransferase complex transferase subunit TsaD [Tissierella sp. MB52-C2]